MKFLAALVFLIAGIALGSPRAFATTCTVPNTFTNGSTADATQVNANFSALQSCGNNIDHTNVGASGIYASQLIPTTVGQAIFGGTFAYSFTSGLSVTGGLTVDTLTLTTPLGQSNILNGYVDLSSTQTVNGTKTFGTIPVWSGALPVGQGGTGATSLSAITTAIKTSSTIQAGTSALTLSAGDLGASRSSTTGALALGGSSISGTLDYGVTNTNTFTFTTNGGTSNIVTAGTIKAGSGLIAASGATVFPNKGQLTCSLSASSACNNTASVGSSTVCTVTYDHSTTASVAVLEPPLGSVSAGTLTAYANTSSNVTASMVMDYTCL